METEREKLIKKLEKMEVENDLKIEKLEALLDILKDEQGIIIETLVGINETGGDE